MINKKALKVIIYEKLHEKSTTQNHMDYDHNFVNTEIVLKEGIWIKEIKNMWLYKWFNVIMF